MTNVAWGFLYSEPEYVDASARAAVTPKPVYSTSRQLANGDLEVVYKVENPAELKIVADKNVSVMALTGTYQNEEAKDTTVTSDYAAILPAVVTFKAIAFNTLETEIMLVLWVLNSMNCISKVKMQLKKMQLSTLSIMAVLLT